MLHIVNDARYGSRFETDFSRGVVVVESDLPLKNGSFHAAIDELTGNEAKHRAIGYAISRGVGDARINGNTSGAYPVNDDGVPLEFVRDEHNNPLPNNHPKMHVKKYRVDVPVTRRLI